MREERKKERKVKMKVYWGLKKKKLSKVKVERTGMEKKEKGNKRNKKRNRKKKEKIMEDKR